MYELVVNLHNHTTYSDGCGKVSQIAKAALISGIDVVFITDHNIYPEGLKGYHIQNDRRVLILTGEEIHDRRQIPSSNHLLILGTGKEYADMAYDRQECIHCCREDGGISILAHPFDPALSFRSEYGIVWNDWQIEDYTGIEIWNCMSEFKSRLHSIFHAIFYTYFPNFMPKTADRHSLQKWDELTTSGKKVIAIGGSDSHNRTYTLGFLKAKLFPYEFHFKSINTHIFTPRPLGEDWLTDEGMIIDALRQGHAFVGYDLPASTKGFQFYGSAKGQTAIMGDEMTLANDTTLHIRLPRKCRCRLLKNGQCIATWKEMKKEVPISQSGVYRIECTLFYNGGWRGWIYSNPIIITQDAQR